MKTTVNGVEITDAMAEVLNRWYDYNEDIDISLPERYVGWLGDVQDFLCDLLDEDYYESISKSLIAKVMVLKNDLKQFYYNSKKEEGAL
jgi:hypothetical protein